MSIIIGLNIVTLIDKKISNISVNIPAVNVPKPTVLLNINDTGKQKINICVDNNNKSNIINSNNDDKPNFIDGENIKNKNIEKFIVADAQEFKKYDKLKKQIVKKEDTFELKNIDNPRKENVVDYDQDKQERNKEFAIKLTYEDKPIYKRKKPEKEYVNASDFGWEAPIQAISCANSSISQKFKSGKKNLLPYQISCNKPNKFTAENYYKTHYKTQIVPIEDYKVRGFNYMNYRNSVQPHKADVRILSQTTKGISPEHNEFKNIPDGSNYAFHNTPAMRMP